MSIHLPSLAVKICPDGTLMFKNHHYRLNVPGYGKLTEKQCEKIIPHLEQILKPQLATLERLDGIKIEKKNVPLQKEDVLLSDLEQRLFECIQDVAFEILSPLTSPIKPQKQKFVKLPPLPALNQKKAKEKKIQFPWPPKRLKENIEQSIQQLQSCLQKFALEANDSGSFFEDFEYKLEEIKGCKKADLKKFATWGTDFYQKELKDRTDIPLFFKDDFKQLLQRIRQASSWKEVQKALENSIKKAHRAHVLDILFHKNASDHACQLGKILLHIYQVDRPQFLQMRLQSADKLYANLIEHNLLKKEDQHSIQALLQELHELCNPLFTPSLEGRVHSPKSIPSYSKWNKIKEALRLIFVAIAQLFQRHHSSINAQETPHDLLFEHEDFDGNLFASEEVLRYDAVLDLVASKQARLNDLKQQEDSLPQYTIRQIEKDLASYDKDYADLTWLPAAQAQKDFTYHQHAQANSETKSYIPALINSRIHQLTTEKDMLIIHRSGAISDTFNTSTHLNQMKMEAMNQWADLIQADTFEEFHSLAIGRLKKHWNVQIYRTLQAIDKRQRLLEDQMVQLIANQVKAHIKDLVDPSCFTLPRLMRVIQITQIGLLNPLKKGSLESGLSLNECNQMLDMAAIFQQFNGKCIQFKDVDAPFMQDEIIYMPLSFLQDPTTGKPIANPDIEEPFDLFCTFFNTSVQGLTINKGQQRTVNENALTQMQYQLENIQNFLEKYPENKAVLKTSLSDLYQRFEDLNAKLERGDTGYVVAQEIARLQYDMQGVIGVNCSDGQDRTSYFVAKLMAQHMDFAIDQKAWPQNEKKALKRKLRRDLMDIDKGLASQIVQQSTGRKALQLYEKEIMGINEEEGLSGDLIRHGYSLFAMTQS